MQEAGKQRYVFFSFPHIAINSKGALGALSRPGQDATSSACGALIAALGQLTAEGLDENVMEPGGKSIGLSSPSKCILPRVYCIIGAADAILAILTLFLVRTQFTLPMTPSTPSSSSASPARLSRWVLSVCSAMERQSLLYLLE